MKYHKNIMALTMSASELIMATSFSSNGEKLYESRVVMNSGREGIAKLMFRYDIPIVHNDDQAIDGEAMLETLFQKLSHLSVVALAQLFINLNISFTYRA